MSGTEIARPAKTARPTKTARPATTQQPARAGDRDWWREGVVYQVYPRSFADSDGNGVGDLQGIIDHLDHLGPGGLGIDAIWLSPIYPSPGLDVGYDVSDHETVDPMFGSEADFDRLVTEAHARGIRIVLDLVMNHTSDRHPWFESSRASRQGPFANWYLWRDPAGFDSRGRPRRPNNWVSFFGGSAWTWEPRRGQFYLHTFLSEQPDLNWRNPAVEEAQFRMVRRWLARGVDGFRLDVFNTFLKDPELTSNPRRRGLTIWTRQVHVHDRDQPDLDALVARFRAIVDEAPGRMSIGELFDGGPDRAAALTIDRHLVFDWTFMGLPWSAAAFAAAIDRREAIYGPDRWPTVVMSNHDQPRHASRLAQSAGTEDIDGIAKAAALILLTLRGTAFMYYGEEIGMVDVVVPFDEIVDPPARRASEAFPWWNRDQCRTPMAWAPGPGAGFTTERPWLRIGDDAARHNVAAEWADPNSILAAYQRLLQARRESAPLHRGSFRRLKVGEPDILAWVRQAGDDRAIVVVSFAREAQTVQLPVAEIPGTWRPLAGTHVDPLALGAPGARLALRGLEGVILVPG